MDQREQYLDTYSRQEQTVALREELPKEANNTCSAKEKKASQHLLSAPARVLLWILGVIVGVTLLFGCGIFWVWGLDYLGVIDYDRTNDGKNEFNQGSSYDEFEEFYDYFNDYFGGSIIAPDDPSGGDDGSQADPQNGTPGIGVTIQEIPTLDFVIEDKYTGGLVIAEISPTGALAGTEVQTGDLIVAANGEATPTIDALDVQLKATGVGGEMVLTLARFVNGVATTYEVTITLIDLSTVD